MVVSRKCIESLDEYMVFRHKEHYYLCKGILEKMSEKLDFKLNIKKASIHLQTQKSFSVIAFRRSKKEVFIEFYSSTNVKDLNILKAYKANNNLIVNRVCIEELRDFSDELIAYVHQSAELIKSL